MPDQMLTRLQLLSTNKSNWLIIWAQGPLNAPFDVSLTKNALLFLIIKQSQRA